jgi:hypothetical protein
MAETTPRSSNLKRQGHFPFFRHLTVFAALSALLALPGLPSASAADTLRWKFTPGESLKYTMEQKTSQGMKAQGQELKTTLNQTVDLHWDVKGVTNGVADMTQTIDRVRTKIEGPGQVFEFDSSAEKAPEGPIATLLTPLLKALVGAEFSFKMDGKGQLTDIKVPQKLLDTLRQAGPAAAAGGVFSEEGMKNLISQSSLALPEGTVEKGANWKQQSKVPVPMIGTLLMDKTYTFAGPDEKAPGRDLITLDTKVTLEPAADSNVAVKISSQQGKGEFSFDNKSGRVVSSHVNDKLMMSISVNGQDLEQSTDTVTTMTLGGGGSVK